MFCTIVTGQNILHVVEYSVCYFICLCADRYLQCDRRADFHRIDASDPGHSIAPYGCRFYRHTGYTELQFFTAGEVQRK